jgi:hypothetical protein
MEKVSSNSSKDSTKITNIANEETNILLWSMKTKKEKNPTPLLLNIKAKKPHLLMIRFTTINPKLLYLLIL